METMMEYLHGFGSNALLYGGTFVLVLSILVFVHEWGHFIVARMCGVRVKVFSIGFGPEIFGYTDKKSGTRWKISAIPLGGYVQMFGDVDPASSTHSEAVTENGVTRDFTEEEKRVAFYNKSVWKRMAIVFAGPAINFLFAIFIFAAVFMSSGKVVIPPSISAVEQGSAAERAGLMPHDVIIKANGREMESFGDLVKEVVLALDTPVEAVILRDGKEINITFTPSVKHDEDRFGFGHSKGYLGIMGPSSALDLNMVLAVNDVDTKGNLALTIKLLKSAMEKGEVIKIKLDRNTRIDDLYIKPFLNLNKDIDVKDSENYGVLVVAETLEEKRIVYGFFGAISEAVSRTYEATSDTLKALGQMVVGTRDATELGGIIRIGAIAGDMADSGILPLLMFAAMLSINLGLINLFPVPLLDGGHLLFYVIEAIKGSPISERVQEHAFKVGFALLIGLMLFANINDIYQLAK